MSKRRGFMFVHTIRSELRICSQHVESMVRQLQLHNYNFTEPEYCPKNPSTKCMFVCTFPTRKALFETINIIYAFGDV